MMVREKRGQLMKETELRVLCELIKNAKQSDKELAKAIQTSQHTVTRTRRRLESEGYIREYTLVPDFHKLGYEMFCLIFIKLKKRLGQREIEKATAATQETLARESPFATIMLERGIGLGYDGVVFAVHENYQSYLQQIARLRQFDFLNITEIDSFKISFEDEVHYRPLTFAPLADHLLTRMGKI